MEIIITQEGQHLKRTIRELLDTLNGKKEFPYENPYSNLPI